MIHENITISSYDNTRSVVSTQEGRNILVNNASVILINILKDSADITSAQQRFNNQFNSNLDIEQFESFIQDKLGRFGILQRSNTTPKRPFEYLPLRFELLNSKVVSLLSRPLKFLYKPEVFWPGAAFFILFLTVTFWNNSQSLSFHSSMIYKIGGLILLSLLVHELGHAAACATAGVKLGGIGVGLYYFFPVLYADITAIWSTKRHMRIIANLAGIFSELMFSSILTAFFLVTSQAEYLATAFYIFTKLLIQLNPFIRLDGYWVLSDVTNTPNLLKKSNQMVAMAITFSLRAVLRRRISLRKVDRSEVLLFIFGMANWSFLFLFVFYTLNIYYEDIVTFPSVMIVIFERIINFDFDNIEIKSKFVMVLAFYLLVIRWIIRAIVKIFQNRLRKVGLTGKK